MRHAIALLLATSIARAVPVPFAPVAGDPDSSRPLAPFGRVESDASGAETLVVDTMRGGVWNAAFRTAESLFQPGKAYEISFRCDIEEQAEGAYILLLMRPADAPNHQRDIANLEVYATPKGDGIVRFRIKMPASGDKSRQAFQIHTFGKLRARIADLQVRELVREFLPADRPFGDATVDARPPPPDAPTSRSIPPRPQKTPTEPPNTASPPTVPTTPRRSRPSSGPPARTAPRKSSSTRASTASATARTS